MCFWQQSWEVAMPSPPLSPSGCVCTHVTSVMPVGVVHTAVSWWALGLNVWNSVVLCLTRCSRATFCCLHYIIILLDVYSIYMYLHGKCDEFCVSVYNINTYNTQSAEIKIVHVGYAPILYLNCVNGSLCLSWALWLEQDSPSCVNIFPCRVDCQSMVFGYVHTSTHQYTHRYPGVFNYDALLIGLFM